MFIPEIENNMKLTRITESTLLNRSNVYQIEDTIYRFLYTDGSIQHPHLMFEPLPGQRKKADLKLSYNRFITCCYCYEIEDLKVDAISTISDKAIQLKLF
jgi:hypothetical protein